MSYQVSHWSGRLGNNIQQVANCIMVSKSTNGVMEQVLDHPIIDKFCYAFGSNENNFSGRFYAWEQTVHCEKGIKEGRNEIGVSPQYVYSRMREICRDYVRPKLKLPQKKVIGDDTIVMHLRSGDNYHKVFDPPTNYVPNPLIFYLNLIDSFDKCILITEPDEENPIVHELKKIDKVKIQSSTVEDDFATLMSAKNVALSGVGTFAMAAALCSIEIKNLYTTDLLLTEHLNFSMLYDTDVTVHTMHLQEYIPVYPCSWANTEEQRKFILEYR